MNQKAFKSLREAGMEEKEAVIIAEHTDMSDVLAALAQQGNELKLALAQQDSELKLALAQQGSELKLEMSELKNALTWRLTTIVAVPVFLALVAGIVSVVANATGFFA